MINIVLVDPERGTFLLGHLLPFGRIVPDPFISSWEALNALTEALIKIRSSHTQNIVPEVFQKAFEGESNG